MVSSTGARFLTTGDPLGYGVRVDAGFVGKVAVIDGAGELLGPGLGLGNSVAVIDGAGELLGPGLGLGSSVARVHSGGSVGASTTGDGDSLATAQPTDNRRNDRTRIRGPRIIRRAASHSTCIKFRSMELRI
jgi:hypothetical protein